MNEQTIKLINDLAARLGTTSEMLWSALIKQAFIDSTATIAQIGILFGSCVWSFKALRAWSKTQDDWGLPEIAYSVWGIWAITVVCMTVSAFPLLIAGFFNPEYWALKQIIP